MINLGADEIRKNLGEALSIFAKTVENVTNSMDVEATVAYRDFVDDLMSYFPMTKVNTQAGTYDQYLQDLRKTVVDNYDKNNYQVAYFYAHLIFMSYIYYSVELAYRFLPQKTKDQYDMINAYSGNNKPNIADTPNVYSFSKIPEKEIFKVFYAIGMDVQYIQQLSSYVKERDDYAHATGKGNIDDDAFKTNIKTVKRNMGTVHKLFQPYIKDKYIAFLIDKCELSHETVEMAISDYIVDENFSYQDIDYLCNLGISNIRNENDIFKSKYSLVRKVHCAFIEHCIETYGISEPTNLGNLRNDTYLYFKYKDNAEKYIERELGINGYECVKNGGEFPLYECPECGEEQLAHNVENGKFHCFHCDEDYTSETLTFCSRCGALTGKNEMDICKNCIEDMVEE